MTSPRESNWNKIPALRRHFYVLTLIFLGAVVGTNVKNALSDPVQNDVAASARPAEVLRMEGMQDSAKSLYYR